MNFDIAWYHWFQLTACALIGGVGIGVWRARLPFDSLLWLLGLGIFGQVLRAEMPGAMPLGLAALAMFTVLLSQAWLESITAERAAFASIARSAAKMRALRRHHGHW